MKLFLRQELQWNRPLYGLTDSLERTPVTTCPAAPPGGGAAQLKSRHVTLEIMTPTPDYELKVRNASDSGLETMRTQNPHGSPNRECVENEISSRALKKLTKPKWAQVAAFIVTTIIGIVGLWFAWIQLQQPEKKTANPPSVEKTLPSQPTEPSKTTKK